MRASSTIGKIIPWVAIGPAVYVNVEATAMPWTPFAIGSVIFAAVFVYLAKSERSFLFGALGAIFVSINITTALHNVASMSAETVDGRNSVIQQRKAINAKRDALNEARKVQVALAGEDAAQAIEGQLKGFIASDAPRYAASNHCNPDKITQEATKSFCDQIAKLEAKKAAAEERARLDRELRAADDKTIFGGPSAADPYAESLARFFSVFGYKPSEEGKTLLSSSKDWGKAIGLELMAAFGPMALMLLFEKLFGLHPALVPGSGLGHAVAEHKPAPLPSITLPAVPRVPAVEPAPVATVIEPDEDKPSLFPPSPRARRRTTKMRKQSANARPGNVIPFGKKPTHSEVLALVASGKTQRAIAASLGIGERTVRRIVAASKTGQVAALTEAKMAASAAT